MRTSAVRVRRRACPSSCAKDPAATDRPFVLGNHLRPAVLDQPATLPGVVSCERVRLLDWDSEFWGVRAARAFVDGFEDLLEADAECRRLSIEWVTLLLPVDRVDLVNAAVLCGYEIFDVRHTLLLEQMPPKRESQREHATLADLDDMAAIAAEAFGISRFFADPHLDDDRCVAFYDTWARNSLSGSMAEAAVVSRTSDGSVAGFITLARQAERVGSLPLVAVRSDLRGGGVARRLLLDALSWMDDHNVSTVSVVTQLSNRAAIRLYESAGFQTIGSGIWLHRWYDLRA
ncbi:MAG: TDP-fucosamine acetyltransferase [Acidimicrobiales bacterium]|nr:TDP-fucosamine acetyltransferase [Acidimicrobiales bacterium]